MANDQPAQVNSNGREPLRLLVFSASLRKGSLNTQLAKLATGVLEKHGAQVDLASMREFDTPSFDQDIETDKGPPEGAVRLRDRILANDAFIISSPEYNGSMPGLIKNSIDWVPMPLEHQGTRVFPNMFSLAMAHKAFDASGHIADEKLAQRFEENILAFLDLVEAAKHYPCIKKAWVEFLGERTDEVTERVE